MEKWEAFGRHVWLLHRTLDLAYLIPVAVNALWLKEDPEAALNAYWLPMITLAMAVPSLEEDFRSAFLWVRGGEGRLPHLLTYCNAHGITTKVFGMLLTAVACLALIFGYRPAHISQFEVEFHNHEDSPEALAAAVNYAFPPPPSPGPPPPDLPDAPLPPPYHIAPSPPYALLPDGGIKDDKFPLWVFLALGLVIQMNYFFQNLIGPSQAVGIAFICMGKMLEGDVTKFMKVCVAAMERLTCTCMWHVACACHVMCVTPSVLRKCSSPLRCPHTARS